MPEEAGSRAGDEAGSVFNRGTPASATTFDETSFGTFKEGLGELGRDKALEPIKDFQGLVKSHNEAQKMIGGSVRLPGKDLGEEDRTKAVGELMGKLKAEGILESTPDSPEKYEIKMPQIEGFQVNQALHDSFRVAAHKFGVTPSVAQGLFDWYVNEQAAADTRENAEFAVMKEGLRTNWGSLYVRKMEAASRALVKHIGEDGDAIISRMPPADGEKMIKAFSVIGDPLLEAGFTAGDVTPFATADALKEEISKMMNDKKGPLMNLSHSGHADAVKKFEKLNREFFTTTGVAK